MSACISQADENKKRRYDEADSEVRGLEVLTRDGQRVEEEDASAHERQGENDQKDGADFGCLGHEPIVKAMRAGLACLPEKGN